MDNIEGFSTEKTINNYNKHERTDSGFDCAILPPPMPLLNIATLSTIPSHTGYNISATSIKPRDTLNTGHDFRSLSLPYRSGYTPMKETLDFLSKLDSNEICEGCKNSNILPGEIKHKTASIQPRGFHSRDLINSLQYLEKNPKIDSLLTDGDMLLNPILPNIHTEKILEKKPKILISRILMCIIIIFFIMSNIIDMFFINIQIVNDAFKYYVGMGTLASLFLCEVLFIIYNIIHIRKVFDRFDVAIFISTVLIVTILDITLKALRIGLVSYLTGVYEKGN